MSYLLYNLTVFCNDAANTLLSNHAVFIKGSRIEDIGDSRTLLNRYSGAEKIDGRGRLLMPGLINTHMHFYSTFARGISLPAAPKNFYEILQMLWWKLDRSLDEEAVYYSALIPAISCIRNGVTAVIDHHASPNAVEGSLERIEAALQRVGLRGLLCYEISDRDGAEIARKGIAENQRYLKKCRSARQDNPDHLFDGLVGLHASFTLEEATLEAAGDLSRQAQRGCHIHLLEDPVDGLITREKYHCGVVERLVRHGILNERSIAAHAIHLSDEEKVMLADSGVIVVHNPQSNMNNAVGRADIIDLNRRGVLLGLGSDGMTADLRTEARVCQWLHKHGAGNPNTGWVEIHNMLFKNNPEIYRSLSNLPVGIIEKGAMADLAIFDYYPITPLTPDNIWGHFLFGIADAAVNTVMINGRLVMKDGLLPGIDESQIAEEARRVAERVWQRFAD